MDGVTQARPGGAEVVLTEEPGAEAPEVEEAVYQVIQPAAEPGAADAGGGPQAWVQLVAVAAGLAALGGALFFLRKRIGSGGSNIQEGVQEVRSPASVPMSEDAGAALARAVACRAAGAGPPEAAEGGDRAAE